MKNILITLTFVFILIGCSKIELTEDTTLQKATRQGHELVDDQYHPPVKWLMVKSYNPIYPQLFDVYSYNERFILKNISTIWNGDTVLKTNYESENDKITHALQYGFDSIAWQCNFLRAETYYEYDQNNDLIFTNEWDYYSNEWDDHVWSYNYNHDSVWVGIPYPGWGRPIDEHNDILHSGSATMSYYPYKNPNPFGRQTSPVTMDCSAYLQNTDSSSGQLHSKIVIDSLVDDRVCKTTLFINGDIVETYIYDWEKVRLDTR